MFGSKKRRIIKSADVISSKMEEMNSLSWGRVLDIAKDLQHNPSVTDARILSDELILIAQTNLSMFSRMGVMPMAMAGQLKEPPRELTEEEKRLASQETVPLKAIGEGATDESGVEAVEKDESSESDAQKAMDSLYGPETKEGTSPAAVQESDKAVSAAKNVSTSASDVREKVSGEKPAEASEGAPKKKSSSSFRTGITQRIGYISSTSITGRGGSKKDAQETTTEDSSGTISYASQSLTEQFRSLGINDVNHVVLPSGVEVIEGGLVEDMLKHPEKAQAPLTPVTPAPENPVDKEFSDALQADFDVIIGGKRKWTFSPRDEAAAHKKTRISRRFGKPPAPKRPVPIIESDIKVLDPVVGETMQEAAQASTVFPLPHYNTPQEVVEDQSTAPEAVEPVESAHLAEPGEPVALVEEDFEYDGNIEESVEFTAEDEAEIAVAELQEALETEIASPDELTAAVAEAVVEFTAEKSVEPVVEEWVEPAAEEPVEPATEESVEPVEAFRDEKSPTELGTEGEEKASTVPPVLTGIVSELTVNVEPVFEDAYEDFAANAAEALSEDVREDVLPDVSEPLSENIPESDSAVVAEVTAFDTAVTTFEDFSESDVLVALEDGAQDTLEGASEAITADDSADTDSWALLSEETLSSTVPESVPFESAYEAERKAIASMVTKPQSSKTSFAGRLKGLFKGSRQDESAYEAAASSDDYQTDEPFREADVITNESTFNQDAIFAPLPEEAAENACEATDSEIADAAESTEVLETPEACDQVEPLDFLESVESLEPDEVAKVESATDNLIFVEDDSAAETKADVDNLTFAEEQVAEECIADEQVEGSNEKAPDTFEDTDFGDVDFTDAADAADTTVPLDEFVAPEPVFKPMPSQKTTLADRFTRLFKRNRHEADRDARYYDFEEDNLIFDSPDQAPAGAGETQEVGNDAWDSEPSDEALLESSGEEAAQEVAQENDIMAEEAIDDSVAPEAETDSDETGVVESEVEEFVAEEGLTIDDKSVADVEEVEEANDDESSPEEALSNINAPAMETNEVDADETEVDEANSRESVAEEPVELEAEKADEKETLICSTVEEMLHDLRSKEVPEQEEEKRKALSLDLTTLGSGVAAQSASAAMKEALDTEIFSSSPRVSGGPRIVSQQDLSSIFGDLDISAAVQIDDSEETTAVELQASPEEGAVGGFQASAKEMILEELQHSLEEVEVIKPSESNETTESLASGEFAEDAEGAESVEAMEARDLAEAPTLLKESEEEVAEINAQEPLAVVEQAELESVVSVATSAELQVEAEAEAETEVETEVDEATELPSNNLENSDGLTDSEESSSEDEADADEYDAALNEKVTRASHGRPKAEDTVILESTVDDESDELAAYKKASRGFHAAPSSAPFEEEAASMADVSAVEYVPAEEMDPIAEMWASLEPAKKPGKKTGKKTGKHADVTYTPRKSLRAALFGEPEEEKGKKAKKGKTDKAVKGGKKAKTDKKSKKDKSGKHNKSGYVSLAQYDAQSASSEPAFDEPFMTASFGEFAQPFLGNLQEQADSQGSHAAEVVSYDFDYGYTEPAFSDPEDTAFYGAEGEYASPAADEDFDLLSPEQTAPLPRIEDESVSYDESDTDEILWDFEEDYGFEKRGKHSSMKFGRHSKGFGKHASLSFDEPTEEEPFVESDSPDESVEDGNEFTPAHAKEVQPQDMGTFHQFYESRTGEFVVYEDEDGHLVSVKTSRLS